MPRGSSEGSSLPRPAFTRRAPPAVVGVCWVERERACRTRLSTMPARRFARTEGEMDEKGTSEKAVDPVVFVSIVPCGGP